MKVLLTRKLEDSLETARQLAEHRVESFIEPLVTIEYIPNSGHIHDFQNVVITSKNAAHAVNEIAPNEKIKIFVVGMRTADSIKNSLKDNLVVAEGNAESLLEKIRNDIPGQKIFYPRGEVASHDLKKILSSSDVQVEEEIIYRVIYKNKISNKLEKLIDNQEITDAVFFSQEALNNFVSIKSEAIKKSVLNLNFVVPLDSYVDSKLVKKIQRFKVGDISSLIGALGK